MQLFKTFISTLFVAAAIAVPAPDADANDVKARAPEFENLDPDVAAIVSLASEFGEGLETRSIEARGLCDIACKASCFVRGKKGGNCRNGTCYCG